MADSPCRGRRDLALLAVKTGVGVTHNDRHYSLAAADRHRLMQDPVWPVNDDDVVQSCIDQVEKDTSLFWVPPSSWVKMRAAAIAVDRDFLRCSPKIFESSLQAEEEEKSMQQVLLFRLLEFWSDLVWLMETTMSACASRSALQY